MVGDEDEPPVGPGEGEAGGEEHEVPHPQPLPPAGGEEEAGLSSDEAEPPLDLKAEGLSVRAGKNRDMQVARKGKRKLFDKARRKLFLKWLAATGNVTFSAAKAGVVYQTVWKHRLKDPRFAEAMDRALDQGIVRAKARLLEDRAKKPIRIGCDVDESELEPPDPQVVMLLIREHERARAGVRKVGRTPRIATNAEVEKALVKRLALFAKRERARRAGGGTP
ncbi:MAG: hypothetical protein QOG84_2618 [Sphingomonadales bacterium]|nr:hypothetical protein [Sphingomonadales bacterium]